MLAAHTFVTALWPVQLQSRIFGFSLVGVSIIFTVLWLGIGNGIHKNYEEPTPVRYSYSCSRLPIITNFNRLVLVLDQLGLCGGTHSRRVCLAVDHIVCFGDNVYPALLLGKGPLVSA
jgi:hypothetical protein